MGVTEAAVEWLRLGDRMAHGREGRKDARPEPRLGADLDRRSEVIGGFHEPAWSCNRRCDVDAAVDERGHDLGVDLRLSVTAH